MWTRQGLECPRRQTAAASWSSVPKTTPGTIAGWWFEVDRCGRTDDGRQSKCNCEAREGKREREKILSNFIRDCTYRVVSLTDSTLCQPCSANWPPHSSRISPGIFCTAYRPVSMPAVRDKWEKWVFHFKLVSFRESSVRNERNGKRNVNRVCCAKFTLFMYRIAVNGRLNEQKSKSDMHNDKTNAVVACPLSFWCCSNATMVIKFPVSKESDKQTEKRENMVIRSQSMQTQNTNARERTENNLNFYEKKKITISREHNRPRRCSLKSWTRECGTTSARIRHKM